MDYSCNALGLFVILMRRWSFAIGCLWFRNKLMIFLVEAKIANGRNLCRLNIRRRGFRRRGVS